MAMFNWAHFLRYPLSFIQDHHKSVAGVSVLDGVQTIAGKYNMAAFFVCLTAHGYPLFGYWNRVQSNDIQSEYTIACTVFIGNCVGE